MTELARRLVVSVPAPAVPARRTLEMQHSLSTYGMLLRAVPDAGRCRRSREVPMAQANRSNGQRPEQPMKRPTVKKPYQTPRLIRYGTLGDLTRGDRRSKAEPSGVKTKLGGSG